MNRIAERNVLFVFEVQISEIFLVIHLKHRLTTVNFIRSNRKWTFLEYVFLLFKKLRHRIFAITVHFIHIHKKFQSLNKRNSTTITYDWKIVLDNLIGSIDMLACFTSSRQSTPNVDLWEWKIYIFIKQWYYYFDHLYCNNMNFKICIVISRCKSIQSQYWHGLSIILRYIYINCIVSGIGIYELSN